jgi:CheY-like chemotaxis protein
MSAPSNAHQNIRVLVAEDDPEIRCELARLLELNGYQVTAVSNGKALLDRLASWLLDESANSPTDLLVTDVRMPGLSGLSIVEGLRANGWSQPIVVISAYSDDEMSHRLEQLSDVTFLAKPFEPAALEALLSQLAELGVTHR